MARSPRVVAYGSGELDRVILHPNLQRQVLWPQLLAGISIPVWPRRSTTSAFAGRLSDVALGMIYVVMRAVEKGEEWSTMPRMTGGQALVEAIKRQGIDTIFGLPGIQLDFLFDALFAAREDIRVIHTRHEQATWLRQKSDEGW